MNAKLYLSIVGLTMALVAASIRPAVTEANGEVLVFKGTQEDMGNVAYTIKPVLGRYLVYRGRPVGGAKPILNLQSHPTLKDESLQRRPQIKVERVFRGRSSARRDLLFTVIEDPTSQHGYLLSPGAGSNVLKASYTLDRIGKHICAGYRCGEDDIAFTWGGAPTAGRMWLFRGREVAGMENVKFTVRGEIGEAMALMPVLVTNP